MNISHTLISREFRCHADAFKATCHVVLELKEWRDVKFMPALCDMTDFQLKESPVICLEMHFERLKSDTDYFLSSGSLKIVIYNVNQKR